MACCSPEEPDVTICKRIEALEDDVVVQGKEMERRRDLNCAGDAFGFWPAYHKSVPKGHVWLAGDNAEASHDSRAFGPVPQGLIRARLLFCIWPLGKFGAVP